jgi:hypothetical protein
MLFSNVVFLMIGFVDWLKNVNFEVYKTIII